MALVGGFVVVLEHPAQGHLLRPVGLELLVYRQQSGDDLESRQTGGKLSSQGWRVELGRLEQRGGEQRGREPFLINLAQARQI